MCKQINQSKRNDIICLFNLGWTNVKISNYLCINLKTVSHWIKRYEETNNIQEKHKIGRKRKTTKEQDEIIIDIIKNKEKNFIIDDVKNEINQLSIYLCNNTIINRMKEYGFYSCYPFKKPYLSELHKQKRLEFAINNYNTDWNLILFSDETTILKDGNFTKKIWISSEVDRIIRKIKHPIKRHVYGCISLGGIESYKIFKENMNSDLYISILDDTIVNYYLNNYMYQQDNSPIHKSKKTLEYLNNKNIKLLNNWPPNSPDLNPIENLWFLLKHKLLNDNITNNNFDECIQLRLNEIKYEHIFNIISCMHLRICQVIQNNGDYINY